MDPIELSQLAIAKTIFIGLVGAVLAAGASPGCSSSTMVAGSGGHPTTGGSVPPATAGSTGSGGALFSGGTSATGGGTVGGSTTKATGGSGSGGSPSVGGAFGGSASGGAIQTGGAMMGGTTSTGSGGSSSTGGATATGGSTSKQCTSAIASAKTWADITAAHAQPAWIKAAKLGIQLHWGLYAVPAYHNEWFFQHLYCNSSFSTWTSQHYPTTSPLSGGPWGYKDFIALFTASKWDAKAWAAAFKSSGATWVQLSAQHHDRFAMWDSAMPASVGGAGKWNAMQMGPKRDLVGELAAAVRAEGMKFGVSNHIMYGDSFAWCNEPNNGTTAGNVGPNTPASVADLYDPKYGDLYGPPVGTCGKLAASTSCSPAQAFCDDWLYRTKELANKYQLDIEWFDWDGANVPNSPCMNAKLDFVLDYYKNACAWGKEVTTAGKVGVFNSDTSVTGGNIMIRDYETGNKAPTVGQEPKSFWMVDDKIGGGTNGNSWGYIDGMTYRTASSINSQIDNYHGRGGVLLLNLSPMADGTLPQGQVDLLTAVGQHVATLK